MVRAAQRIDMRATVATREILGGTDPLRRPLELGNLAAGADHIAARVDDGVQPLALPAQRRRQRLVEQRAALIKAARLHERRPELAQSAQLEIHILEPTRQFPRLTRPPLPALGIARIVRAQQRNPARKRRQLELLDQPRRPAQPAARRGPVAKTNPIEEVQPHRHQRGLDGIRPAPERRIRALLVTNGRLGLAQPPQRVAQPGQCLRALLVLEDLLECSAGRRQVAPPECLRTRVEQCLTVPHHASMVDLGQGHIGRSSVLRVGPRTRGSGVVGSSADATSKDCPQPHIRCSQKRKAEDARVRRITPLRPRQVSGGDNMPPVSFANLEPRRSRCGYRRDAIHLVSADSRADEPRPCFVRSAGKRVPRPAMRGQRGARAAESSRGCPPGRDRPFCARRSIQTHCRQACRRSSEID